MNHQKQSLTNIEHLKHHVEVAILTKELSKFKGNFGYCTRIIPAAGNGESCLGSVFRPFSYSHQCRFQIRLRQLDISAFSGRNKVTKMCPKYLLTRYY